MNLIEEKNLDIIIPGALIALSELFIYQGWVDVAVILHSLNLVLLATASAYSQNRSYLALMLMPLFRLLNIAMPVFFSLTLYSFAVVYAPMFIPIYLIFRSNSFSRKEIGLTSRGIAYYIPLGVFIGLLLGWIEYQVIHPPVLAPDLGIKGLVTLSVVMILFVGVIEEFVFRSALQTVICERFGIWGGLLISSIFFGLMHSGYRVPGEIIFTFVAGMVFGLLFWRTGSLVLVTLAHGVTNISLFMVVPAYAGYLAPMAAVSLLIYVMAGIKCHKGPLSLKSLRESVCGLRELMWVK